MPGFGSPSNTARRRQESLTEARRGCKPSRRVERGQEAILEGREESGVTSGEPGWGG